MSKLVTVARTDVNFDRLYDDLQVLGSLFISHGKWSDAIYVVLADEATEADETTARNIIINHNKALLTEAQQRNVEKVILFEQVNARFIEEVIKALPDWDDCYNDIAEMVTGQTAVTNALTNVIT